MQLKFCRRLKPLPGTIAKAHQLSEPTESPGGQLAFEDGLHGATVTRYADSGGGLDKRLAGDGAELQRGPQHVGSAFACVGVWRVGISRLLPNSVAVGASCMLAATEHSATSI